MGMIDQVLAPGVKDGGEGDLRAEAFAPELQEGGAGAVEEQIVDGLGVLQRQRTQPGRQREDPMKIAHGQQSGALFFEPVGAALMLARGTVTIAAARRPPVTAVAILAMPHRPAELAGAALGQTAEDSEVMDRQSVSPQVFGQE